MMAREYVRDPESGGALILQHHQAPFVCDCRTPIIYGAGGWGSGKSYALLAKIGVLLSYNRPGHRGAVVLPTGPLLSKFLRAQFVPSFTRLITDYSKTEQVITIAGKREIYFISAFEPERLELLTLAWVCGDEAGLWPHETMRQIVSRVRDPRARVRQVAFVGVPRYGWLHEEFGAPLKPGRAIYRMKTSDNKRVPAEYIESLVAACPSRLRECYLDGEFVAPGGNVYPEFCDVHIIAWDDAAVRPVKTVAAIDWSPRTPHVLIAQIVGDGVIPRVSKLSQQHAGAAVVITDELVVDGSNPITVERLAMMIRERGWRIDEIVCDPAGGAAEATSGIDQIRIAQSVLGVRAIMPRTPAQRNIRNGIDHVRALLDPAKDGTPRLYISQRVEAKYRTLPHHIRNRSVVNAMRSYTYPDDIRSSDPVKDGVVDHAADCVRYLAVMYFPIARLVASAQSSL